MAEPITSVELTPSPELRPYVQLIWCCELDQDASLPPERIAPDGIAELVLHYRGRMAARLAGADFTPIPGAGVVCQATRYADIRPCGSVGFVSVRFRPWGAMHFLEQPLSELADQIVPAADLWGRGAALLEERLALAGGLSQRAALVEEFLRERLARRPHRGVEGAIRAVWRRGGQVQMPELCRELGIGDRTAQRLFGAAVGMPPKRYARLVRFLSTCAVLRGTQWPSLARVAADAGYYDQAHLVADFKDFSGLTPHQLAIAPAFSFLALE